MGVWNILENILVAPGDILVVLGARVEVRNPLVIPGWGSRTSGPRVTPGTLWRTLREGSGTFWCPLGLGVGGTQVTSAHPPPPICGARSGGS